MATLTNLTKHATTLYQRAKNALGGYGYARYGMSQYGDSGYAMTNQTKSVTGGLWYSTVYPWLMASPWTTGVAGALGYTNKVKN